MKSDQLFMKWFVAPMKMLQSLPDNDGSFIALSTALFLYERYVNALLKSVGEKATPKKRVKQLSKDFTINEETAGIFWKVMRDGLLHQGMPKQLDHGKNKFPDWQFQHSQDSRPIELYKALGKELLLVQPWIFANRTVELWQENINLLDQTNSFPWAQVYNFSIFINRDSSLPYIITGSPMNLGDLEDDLVYKG